jgi:SAM-dependent methyltransferase
MTPAGENESIPSLVCPACHGALRLGAGSIQCQSCQKTFEYEDGFPNLILGGRFGDEPNAERTAYEEECNLHTAQHYLLPLFKDLFGGAKREPRILSLGCGTGVDVDLLGAAGFDMVGIDCGARSSAWPHREHRHRLLLANGRHLPFERGAFDAVYCGCVFPHVGTVGDSHTVRPDYFDDRRELASEMSRVLRPGGWVLVSSPNRKFPLDIFHGRTVENPMPRLNRPGDPFLLSFEDYQNLFRPTGCSSFQLLPVNGYWGFVRRKKTAKGRLSMLPVDALFKMISQPAFSGLRNSPLNPWLVVLGKKEAA